MDRVRCLSLCAILILFTALSWPQTTNGVLAGDFSSGNVFFYDNNMNLVATYKAGASPSGFAVAPDQRQVFVANLNGGYLSVIDSTIAAETARIHNIDAYTMAISPDGTYLAAAPALAPNPNFITVVNADNFLGELNAQQVIATNGQVCDDSTPPNCDSATNNLGLTSIVIVNNQAYANTAGYDIAVFNLQTEAVSGIPGTAIGAGNFGRVNTITATPDGKYVIAARSFGGNNPNSVLLVISTQTNSLVSTIQLGFNPTSVTTAQSTNLGGTIVFAGGNDGNGNGFVQAFREDTSNPSILTGATGAISIPVLPTLAAASQDGTRLFLAQNQGQLAAFDAAALLNNPSSALIGLFNAAPVLDGIAAVALLTTPPSTAPTLGSATPSLAINNVNNTITITGGNFSSDAVVRFGNLSPVAATVSGGTLQATIPAGAGAQPADIIVTDPNLALGEGNIYQSGILRGQLSITSPPTFQPVNQVVVGNFGDSDATVLNVGTNAGVGAPITGINETLGVAITPDGTRALLGSFGGQGISQNGPALNLVNLVNNTLEQTLTLPQPQPNPVSCCLGQQDGVALANNAALQKLVGYATANVFLPDGNEDLELYMVDASGSSSISLIQTLSAGLDISPANGIWIPGGVAVSKDGRYVYAAIQASFFANSPGEFVIFDTVAGTAQTFPSSTAFGGGNNFQIFAYQGHIEISPDGNWLLLLDVNGGIDVFSLANPIAPAFVGQMNAPAPTGLQPLLLEDYRIASGVPDRVIAFDANQNVVVAFNFFPASSPGIFSAINSIVVPGDPGVISNFGMDLTPDGSLAYLGIASDDEVAAININNLVSGSAPIVLTKIVTGHSPAQIAVRPGTPVAAAGSPDQIVTVTPNQGITISLTGPSAGTVTVATTNTTQFSAPAGFQLGNIPTYYEVSSTSTFSTAVVCFQYNPSQVPSPESSLRLAHYNTATDPNTGQVIGWEDVTLTGYPNTTTHTICGQVTSFSPFVIGISSPTFLFDSLLENISVLLATETPTGVMRSLRAKVLAARSSFTRGNNTSAINQLNALINELNSIAGSQISRADAQNLTGQAQSLIGDLE